MVAKIKTFTSAPLKNAKRIFVRFELLQAKQVRLYATRLSFFSHTTKSQTQTSYGCQS